MERKMFSGNRYMTKGIQTFLRPDLQILLWDLIDGLDVEKDYLQIFRLEMKEKDLSVLEENVETENKSEIEIYKGFTDYKKEELEKFLKNMELAMTFEDLEFIQNYFNETEKRLAERYHHMELGTCKICEECHKKEHLSLPIGCWCVGSDFNKTSKRILFVGKNARNNPGTIEDGFRNPFQYTRESLWNKSWPYWSYTRAITQRIFGDDSIEHIAFTNIVKCNNSGGKDTTSDFVKSNCILNLKVLQQELKVIHPTHIIFYTSWYYDDYIPNVFDRYNIHYNGFKDIGKRKMPWQEAISTLGNQTFHVLRVGHPQCKKKSDFVYEISKWLEPAL